MAVLTKKLGAYYLVGAFVVGLAGCQYNTIKAASGKPADGFEAQINRYNFKVDESMATIGG